VNLLFFVHLPNNLPEKILVMKFHPSFFLKYSSRGMISAALLIFMLGACQPKESPKKDPAPAETSAPGYNPYKDASLFVEVFKVDSIENNGSRGWGYDIIMNGEVHIHQPHIPAIMGNNGFSSEEKALKAGEFVIQKIKNNILPPRVTPEELDSLGVLD
jgi:hypothetical protein